MVHFYVFGDGNVNAFFLGVSELTTVVDGTDLPAVAGGAAVVVCVCKSATIPTTPRGWEGQFVARVWPTSVPGAHPTPPLGANYMQMVMGAKSALDFRKDLAAAYLVELEHRVNALQLTDQVQLLEDAIRRDTIRSAAALVGRATSSVQHEVKVKTINFVTAGYSGAVGNKEVDITYDPANVTANISVVVGQLTANSHKALPTDAQTVTLFTYAPSTKTAPWVDDLVRRGNLSCQAVPDVVMGVPDARHRVVLGVVARMAASRRWPVAVDRAQTMPTVLQALQDAAAPLGIKPAQFAPPK